MTPQNDLSSRIEVVVNHSPLAFIYDLFKPTITINQQVHRRPWGTHSFPTPSGDYKVSVSYPWLFASECGKNTVHFFLHPGATMTVRYRAGLIRYLPGQISVE